MSGLFLSDAKYREGKGIITLFFQGEDAKIKKSYRFLPSFAFMCGEKEAKACKKLLEGFDVSFSEGNGVLRIFSKSFKELKSAHAFICNTTQIRPVLLEPERQFLILKNWSYYDAFTENKCLQRIEALAYVPEHAEDVSSVCLSNILRIRKEELFESTYKQRFAFLENALFASGMQLTSAQNGHSPKTRLQNEQALRYALTIIKNNIGFDTVNCKCCRPSSLNDKNVLPSSLVLASFFQNGFYFNSLSKAFAEHYHRTHENKASREIRKQEFVLPSYPVGPLFTNSMEAIPLADAMRLQQKGLAKIHKPICLHWVCKKKPSKLALELTDLLRKMSFAHTSLREAEKHALITKGLMAYIEDNLTLYLGTYLNIGYEILKLSIESLLSTSSAFFNYSLASSVECAAEKGVYSIEKAALLVAKQSISPKQAKI